MFFLESWDDLIGDFKDFIRVLASFKGLLITYLWGLGGHSRGPDTGVLTDIPKGS